MTQQYNGTILDQTAVASTSVVYSEDFELDDTVTALKLAWNFNVAGTIQVQYRREGYSASPSYSDLKDETATVTANHTERLIVNNPPRRGRVSFTPAAQPWTGWLELQLERAAR